MKDKSATVENPISRRHFMLAAPLATAALGVTIQLLPALPGLGRPGRSPAFALAADSRWT